MSVRDSLKRLAYSSGALARRHRKQNRTNLTIVMFHRVLREDDPRFAGADPEWTLTDRLFTECLEFLKQNYTVIGPEQLEAFRGGNGTLGECPLLLTFDDGWADNADTALPILEEAGLRGFVFVVSEAIGSSRAFWQEQLFAAWKTGRLSPSQCANLWFEAGGTAPPDGGVWRRPEGIRKLIARLESLESHAREAVLVSASSRLAPEAIAPMLSAEQVVALHNYGLRIGSHGASHLPLTRSTEPERELRESRAALREVLGQDITSLSFPHGAHDARVVELCAEVGYEFLFTSEECLNDFSSGALPRLLGRINIAAHEISTSQGSLAPERLATWLFTRNAKGPAR